MPSSEVIMVLIIALYIGESWGISIVNGWLIWLNSPGQFRFFNMMKYVCSYIIYCNCILFISVEWYEICINNNKMLTIQLDYPQNFHAKYQRNNKRSGHKNLRCFPICADEGHTEKGFCGNSIIANINIMYQGIENSLPLHIFGEFNLETESRYFNGQILKLDEIINLVRTQTEVISRPIYEPTITKITNNKINSIF